MDFRSLREYAREIALSVLGVPPFIAGVLDKANYANARKQEEVYWQGTIKRYLSGVQDALNNHLLPKLKVDGVKFYYNWESVQALVEDYDAKLGAAEKLFKMGVPLEVINERLDLGIDTERVPQAEVAFLPATFMAADRVADPPAPPPMPPPTDDNERNDEGEAGDEQRAAKTADAHDRAVRDVMEWKRLDRQQLDLVKRFERTIRSHFEDLRKEAERNLTRGVRSVKIQRAIRKQDEPTEVPPNVYGIIDWEDADARAVRITEEQYKQAATRGGESIIAELGLAGSFNVQNPRVQAALLAREQAIKGINETTRKELLEAFERLVSAEGGTTMDELRKVADEVFRGRKRNARTVARTEVGSAYSTGRYEQMREAGVKRKRWLASQDADVRPSHRALNGVEVGVNDVFPNGLEYPRAPGGPASQVINCRCEAVPVLEDD
jgi:SPP1 gp7 family putative phage head morphogenesis protein